MDYFDPFRALYMNQVFLKLQSNPPCITLNPNMYYIRATSVICAGIWSNDSLDLLHCVRSNTSGCPASVWMVATSCHCWHLSILKTNDSSWQIGALRRRWNYETHMADSDGFVLRSLVLIGLTQSGIEPCLHALQEATLLLPIESVTNEP